jgi:hypothetical protein
VTPLLRPRLFSPAVPLRVTCAALVGLATACGSQDGRVATKLASDFAPARRTISVLGVYKDGQMSSDAWETMGPKLSPSLGAPECEGGYSDTLRTNSEALSAAIEDYARSNGPTDDLLAQIAPAAKGDLIVVFTFAGKLPAAAPKPKESVATNSGPPGVGQSAPRTTGGGGMGRRGGRNGQPMIAAPTDPNELDISASVFSVAQGRSVGLVTMQYAGASVDDAMAKFAAQLAQALPQASCQGWDWNAKIDAEHLRQIIDQ